MTGVEKISLHWKDFSTTVSASFDALRRDSELFDVILVTEDEVHFSAHKLVLSACSGFFKDFIKKVNHPNPLLYLGGVESKYLHHVMDYLYLGEVKILQEDVEEFLKCSSKLKISGLEVTNVGRNAEPPDIKDEQKEPDRNDSFVDDQVMNLDIQKLLESDNEDIFTGKDENNVEEEDEADEMYQYAMNLNIDEILADSMEEEEEKVDKDKDRSTKIKVSSLEEIFSAVKKMVVKEDNLFKCSVCDYKSLRRHDCS